MVASFPYLSRTYSQAAPGPQAAAAIMYTPYGGGFGSLPQSRYTAPAPKSAPRAEMSMVMAGDYNG